MTALDLVVTAVVSGAAAYLGSYLRKKGENRALHEDIDKLVQQVSAVTTTTKQIEAKISNETWRRERKSDLQLKTIESVSVLTTEFIQRYMADSNHRPSLEWYSAFSVADGAVKALFDDDAYKSFKALEVLIGPDLGGTPGSTFAVWKFVETRDAAIKLLYGRVFDST